jgi:hypothetical protein
MRLGNLTYEAVTRDIQPIRRNVGRSDEYIAVSFSYYGSSVVMPPVSLQDSRVAISI